MSKTSTGYFTPQAKKSNKKKRAQLSDNEENEDSDCASSGFNKLVEDLLKCPSKKKMILKILSSNKDAIKQYERDNLTNSTSSQLSKGKSKKPMYESPSALLRRRALEQMNGSSSTDHRSKVTNTNTTTCSESSSTTSTSSVPFDKILEGVIAYVEVKCQDQDRSAGAKAVLKSMGAEVKENFTNDVTHVIFKDGLYTTYQKAKLLKIHLVSILWVEFCRKTMKRQHEKQYPAMRGVFVEDECSIVCSQMQKEYEDIIRDEYRQSIVNGTPLPSTRSLINRRRTLMTPSVSNLNLNSSSTTSTFETAAGSIPSPKLHKQNVNNQQANNEIFDSDVVGSVVNVSVEQQQVNSVASCILKSVENLSSSDMELTNIGWSQISPNKKTNVLTKKITKLSNYSRRKTICSSLMSSDLSSSMTTSNQSTGDFLVPKKMSLRSKKTSGNESFVFGKTHTKVIQNEVDTTANLLSDLNVSNSTSMSSLQLSKTTDCSKSTGKTSMSELRLSISGKEEKELDTSFSSLRLSVSEKKTPKKCNSLEMSKVVQNVIEVLESDESEILSPRKPRNARKSCYAAVSSSSGDGESGKKERRKSLRGRKKSIARTPDVDKELVVNVERSPLVNAITNDVSHSNPSKGKRKLYDAETDHLVLVDEEAERAQARKKNLNEHAPKNPAGPTQMATKQQQNGESSPPKRARRTIKDNVKTDVMENKKDTQLAIKTPRSKGRVSPMKSSKDSDEQKELLEEVLKKKADALSVPKTPKSQKDTLGRTKRDLVTPNRRSTLDFQTTEQITLSRKIKKIDKTKLPTIVCTKLHRQDVHVFAQIVKKLGRFNVEDEVNDKTTHLVVGEAKRTINMLRAIARGCWVLKFDWVLHSLEAGKWLPEEDFEATEFSPIVQKARLERQAFGPKYTLDVFESCPPIYVAPSTIPRCSDLRELIKLCRGRVVTTPRMAGVLVGADCAASQDGAVRVSELWVLDCITFNRKFSFRNYLVVQKNGSKRSSTTV